MFLWSCWRILFQIYTTQRDAIYPRGKEGALRADEGHHVARARAGFGRCRATRRDLCGRRKGRPSGVSRHFFFPFSPGRLSWFMALLDAVLALTILLNVVLAGVGGSLVWASRPLPRGPVVRPFSLRMRELRRTNVHVSLIRVFDSRWIARRFGVRSETQLPRVRAAPGVGPREAPLSGGSAASAWICGDMGPVSKLILGF